MKRILSLIAIMGMLELSLADPQPVTMTEITQHFWMTKEVVNKEYENAYYFHLEVFDEWCQDKALKKVRYFYKENPGHQWYALLSCGGDFVEGSSKPILVLKAEKFFHPEILPVEKEYKSATHMMAEVIEDYCSTKIQYLSVTYQWESPTGELITDNQEVWC